MKLRENLISPLVAKRSTPQFFHGESYDDEFVRSHFVNNEIMTDELRILTNIEYEIVFPLGGIPLKFITNALTGFMIEFNFNGDAIFFCL